jgi:hypothetical protein
MPSCANCSHEESMHNHNHSLECSNNCVEVHPGQRHCLDDDPDRWGDDGEDGRGRRYRYYEMCKCADYAPRLVSEAVA